MHFSTTGLKTVKEGGQASSLSRQAGCLSSLSRGYATYFVLSSIMLCIVCTKASGGHSIDNKAVTVHFTERAPAIDAIIEEVWHQADSAGNFVQFSPYAKEAPTEKTVVYLLQDKENLYFAFHCYALIHKPTALLTGLEDYIQICIDPFGSKTTAYYFTVYASGVKDDGLIHDDGRTYDSSWDGVWFRAVTCHDDHYIVEIKIPFKTIRYKSGLDRWGVQFERYIEYNKETDYWTEIDEIEGDLVSRFGTLRGIQPSSTGYHFELYPVGFVRYDKYREVQETYKLRGSLNFAWNPTSETTINSTLHPDFAQIESDPFSLNLSQYPIYLGERRPFFIEGKEVYRMSDFGPGRGFYRPLNIFYSRKIGKSIDGEVIPIIGGLKVTHRTETWNAGVLGAYTDRRFDNGQVKEPERAFGVMRAKRKIFENSDIGILVSGTRANGKDYNYALGLDGVYREGSNQFILQGAVSERTSKRGWALSSGFSFNTGNFLTMGSTEVVHDSFDVSDMGYVPWAGKEECMIASGPFLTFQKGICRNLYIAPGFIGSKEPDQEKWSKIGYFIVNPNFRNHWGFSLEMYYGPAYEGNVEYRYREVSLSTWGQKGCHHINFGGNYEYSYNYRREHLGYQGSGWISGSYVLISQVSASLGSNTWAEWDSLNTLVEITSRIMPKIDYRVNADMTVSVFNEFVMSVPETDFGAADLLSNRLGLLFSWNFLPKSWLYIALNDFRERDEQGHLVLQNSIGAIKAKYLIYF
jgi:hypothetical protein